MNEECLGARFDFLWATCCWRLQTLGGAIGLVLSGVAINNTFSSSDSPWQAALTALVISLVSCFAPGLLGRLPVLCGLTVGFVACVIMSAVTDDPLRKLDFTNLNNAAWVAPPNFYYPVLDWEAVSLIVPVVFIQIAGSHYV